jgi:hypothetical protein
LTEPSTEAARALLQAHPDLDAAAVVAVEQQACGQGMAQASDRAHRVLDRLRSLLTVEQLSAATAVLALDPDRIAELDDATLRLALDGFVDPTTTYATADEAREAARRYLMEIM